MAKREFFILITVFLIATFSTGQMTKWKPKISTGSNYQFFQFVLQWPPATCKEPSSCTTQELEKFTIHGVWPSKYSQGRVEYCSGTTFSEKTVCFVYKFYSSTVSNFTSVPT